MGDMIDRDAALRVADEVFDLFEKKGDDRGAFAAAEVCERIRAIPAADTSEAIGILQARVEDQATEIARLTRIIQMQPPRIPAADARAEALKEAADVASAMGCQAVAFAILDLIPETKP